MTASYAAKLIGLPLLAYLLGSIPWGVPITFLFTAKDIRREGSGNIGATNVRRIAGSGAGALVLAGDVLKGALPVYLASTLANSTQAAGQVYLSLVALAAFCGHLYPLYLGFKGGGKGVATALGCLLFINPAVAGISLLVFVLMICIGNRMSMGSLGAAAVLPVLMWLNTGAWVPTLWALVIAAFVFARHKGNLLRLFQGTEPVIWK